MGASLLPKAYKSADQFGFGRGCSTQRDSVSKYLTTTPASLESPSSRRDFMSRSTPENLENILIDALEYYQEEEGTKIKTRTYSDVGMLTTDRGLVVSLPDGSQFQVTIVQSK